MAKDKSEKKEKKKEVAEPVTEVTEDVEMGEVPVLHPGSPDDGCEDVAPVPADFFVALTNEDKTRVLRAVLNTP